MPPAPLRLHYCLAAAAAVSARGDAALNDDRSFYDHDSALGSSDEGLSEGGSSGRCAPSQPLAWDPA